MEPNDATPSRLTLVEESLRRALRGELSGHGRKEKKDDGFFMAHPRPGRVLVATGLGFLSAFFGFGELVLYTALGPGERRNMAPASDVMFLGLALFFALAVDLLLKRKTDEV